jgi:hypothetical protein
MAAMPPQAPPLVLAANPADAQAQALANALRGAGWNPIVTATPGQFAGYARVCVVYLAPDPMANQIAQAAIQAGFPCLIPVTAQPMPLPPANWTVPAVVIGADLSLALLNLIPIIAHFLAPLPPTVAPPPTGAPPLSHPPVGTQPPFSRIHLCKHSHPHTHSPAHCRFSRALARHPSRLLPHPLAPPLVRQPRTVHRC